MNNNNVSINSLGIRSKRSLRQEQPLLAEDEHDEEEEEKIGFNLSNSPLKHHRSNQNSGSSSSSSSSPPYLNTQVTSKEHDYEFSKDSLSRLKEWPSGQGSGCDIEDLDIDNGYMVNAASSSSSPPSSSRERRNWNSGLADFYQDPLTCCYGCVCPALLFADNVAMVHQGREESWWEAACTHVGTDALSLLWLSCIWPLIIPIPFSVPQRVRQRLKIRKYLNINGSLIEDVLVHLCCYPCALLQEHRQALEIRRVPILDDDDPAPPVPIIAAIEPQEEDPAGEGVVGPMA